MNKYSLLGLTALSFFLNSCSNSTELTADNVSAVLNSINQGIIKVGDGLAGTTGRGRGVDDICDDHAQVKATVANSGDPEYPGLVHYCLIAKNSGSPDSAQGAYSLLVNISCAIAASGGITFNGTPETRTLTPSLACFSQDQIDEIGSSLEVTLTGSLNPTFAPHFSHGVELSIPMASMTFKFATKVTGTLVEFGSFENGQGQSAFAGAFDSATGKVWYEARMRRFDDICRKNRDCGWSRHIRIYADIAETSGSDITLDAYSGIYADTQKTGFNGRIASAHGNSTDGLYVMEFGNSGAGDAATLANPTDSSWVLANATGACLDMGGTGTCLGNTGLNAKSAAANGDFFLIPSASSFTEASEWLEAYTGLTFTTATYAD